MQFIATEATLAPLYDRWVDGTRHQLTDLTAEYCKVETNMVRLSRLLGCGKCDWKESIKTVGLLGMLAERKEKVAELEKVRVACRKQ